MFQSKLSLEDMQALSEEISHLVQAGMPLVESLAEAGAGRGVRLTRVMQTLSEGLSQGKTLPELIQRESIGAPRMLASAIGAGIQSNSLGLTVELMGDFAADVVDLRNRLLQAAAYPLTVVLIASVMLILFVQNTLEMFLETIVSWDLQINKFLMTLLEWNQAAPWWTYVFPVGLILLTGLWIISGRASTMAFQGPEKIFLLLPGVRPLPWLGVAGLDVADAGGAGLAALLVARCADPGRRCFRISPAGTCVPRSFSSDSERRRHRPWFPDRDSSTKTASICVTTAPGRVPAAGSIQ